MAGREEEEEKEKKSSLLATNRTTLFARLVKCRDEDEDEKDFLLTESMVTDSQSATSEKLRSVCR